MDSLKALIWLLAGMILAVCAVIVSDTVEQQLIAHKVPSVSAKCKDGYSTSKRKPGTCAKHGGVEVWIIR